MRWIILVILMFGVGCGWYPFPYETGTFVAHSDCIEVQSDFPIYQFSLDQNVLKVRLMLNDANIVKDEDFCDEFQGVPVVVSSMDRVHDSQDYGYYNRLRGVLLSHDGSAMLHEFLHEVDVTRNHNICSASHCGWRENGYYELDEIYAPKTYDLRSGRSNLTLRARN